MKRLFILILAVIIFPIFVYAAGSVSQTQGAVRDDHGNISAKTVTFTCTGDSSDGSIPTTNTNSTSNAWIKGWYLYNVGAYPVTEGATAPSVAHVFLYNSHGLDLLGSEDGNVTAYEGLNLIRSTMARRCLPNMYLPRAGLHLNYFPLIDDTLTLKVASQTTASAQWVIDCVFIR